jgi:hypothetical protein
MNVEIGAEAALFPEKEYISGIFVAVSVCQIVVPTSPSLSKLVTLAGRQINASKFVNRPKLKGSRQMLWYLYVS